MEKVIERYLVKGENVHHKNGVKNDNRESNLELWVTSQPSGQRPEDLVEWAEEILKRYKGTIERWWKVGTNLSSLAIIKQEQHEINLGTKGILWPEQDHSLPYLLI